MKRAFVPTDDSYEVNLTGMHRELLIAIFLHLNWSDLSNVFFACKAFNAITNIMFVEKVNPVFKEYILTLREKGFIPRKKFLNRNECINIFDYYFKRLNIDPIVAVNIKDLISGICFNDVGKLRKHKFNTSVSNNSNDLQNCFERTGCELFDDQNKSEPVNVNINELYVLERKYVIPILAMLEVGTPEVSNFFGEVIYQFFQQSRLQYDINNNDPTCWGILLNLPYSECMELVTLYEKNMEFHTTAAGAKSTKEELRALSTMHTVIANGITLAIKQNRIDILNFLQLSKFVEPQSQPQYFYFVLTNVVAGFPQACKKGFDEMVKFIWDIVFNPHRILIDKLCREKFGDKYNYFDECFLRALENQRYSICKYFIEKGVVSEIKDLTDFSPNLNDLLDRQKLLDWISLHPTVINLNNLFMLFIKKATSEGSYIVEVKKLLGLGVNINFSPDPQGHPTALYFSVFNQNIGLTKLLIDNSADTKKMILYYNSDYCFTLGDDPQQHYGALFNTHPLWTAINVQNKDIVEYLLSKKIDFNFYGWSPVMVAALEEKEMFDIVNDQGQNTINRLQVKELLEFASKSQPKNLTNLWRLLIHSPLIALTFETGEEISILDSYPKLDEYLELTTSSEEIPNFMFNCCVLPPLELQLYLYRKQGDSVNASLLDKFIECIHSAMQKNKNVTLTECYELWKKNIVQNSDSSLFSPIDPQVPLIEKLVEHAKNYYRPEMEVDADEEVELKHKH